MITGNVDRLAEIRRRLSDVSWWMRCTAENIARRRQVADVFQRLPADPVPRRISHDSLYRLPRVDSKKLIAIIGQAEFDSFDRTHVGPVRTAVIPP